MYILVPVAVVNWHIQTYNTYTLLVQVIRVL